MTKELQDQFDEMMRNSNIEKRLDEVENKIKEFEVRISKQESNSKTWMDLYSELEAKVKRLISRTG